MLTRRFVVRCSFTDLRISSMEAVIARDRRPPPIGLNEPAAELDWNDGPSTTPPPPLSFSPFFARTMVAICSSQLDSLPAVFRFSSKSSSSKRFFQPSLWIMENTDRFITKQWKEKKYTFKYNIFARVSFQDYLIRNFFLLRDIIYFLISNLKLSENIAIESRREISSGMHHVRSLFFSFFHLKSTRFTRGIKSVSLNIRSNRVISTWKQHSLHIVTQRNVNVNR